MLPGRASHFSIDSGPEETDAASIFDAIIPFARHERLIRHYLDKGAITAVPGFLIADCISSVTDLQPELASSVNRYRTVTKRITQTTRQPLDSTTPLTLAAFQSLCTAQSIRWDHIGVLLALSGLSALLFQYQPAFQEPGQISCGQHAAKMVKLSNACVAMSLRCGSPTIFTVWMAVENLNLMSMQYGEASESATSNNLTCIQVLTLSTGNASWNRLCDLSATIYAVGLHIDMDTHNTETPPFYRELRRRLYAMAYSRDKSICTFLGRSVRISSVFSNMEPPTAASEGEICFNTSRTNWSGNSKLEAEVVEICPSALIKQAFVVGLSREEILNIYLGVSSDEDCERLQ
jgi:hypothetical protein